MSGAVARPWAIITATLGLIVGLAIAYTTSVPPRPLKAIHHENPATVSFETEPAALVEWYLAVGSKLASWKLVEAKKLVLQLERATLPPEIRSIVADLNSLLIQEISLLEAADGRLRDISKLIEAGKTDAATRLLIQFKGDVGRAQILLADVTQAIQELARQINIDALGREAPPRRAYEEALRVLERVRGVLVAYGTVANDSGTVAELARLLPYGIKLELVAPPTAYPGRPFAVSGKVTEEAPVPSSGRLLIVRLDDQILLELPLGPFQRKLVLPPGTPIGVHLLTATVPSQGRYLGTTVQREILVTQVIPALRIRPPSHAFVPGQLTLSGTASSELGPLTQASVQARIGQAIGATQTSDTGTFQLTLELPTALSLVGVQKLSVQLAPREPWHAPGQLDLDLFVINLLSTGLLVLVLPVAGILYAYAASGRRQSIAADLAAVADLREKPSVPILEQQTGMLIPEGLCAQLVAIYLGGLTAVQEATGLHMQPSTTLREFVRQVVPQLRGRSFAQMTDLAEIALYSPHPITHDLVDLMERLKVRLQRELAGATSQDPVELGIPESLHSQFIAVYLDALRVVQEATGLRMKPSSTLREYMRQVQPQLRSQSFAQMTDLVEAAQYSSPPITRDLLELMHRLKVQLHAEHADAAS